MTHFLDDFEAWASVKLALAMSATKAAAKIKDLPDDYLIKSFRIQSDAINSMPHPLSNDTSALQTPSLVMPRWRNAVYDFPKRLSGKIPRYGTGIGSHSDR